MGPVICPVCEQRRLKSKEVRDSKGVVEIHKVCLTCGYEWHFDRGLTWEENPAP